jgi:hypothetical protein
MHGSRRTGGVQRLFDCIQYGVGLGKTGRRRKIWRDHDKDRLRTRECAGERCSVGRVGERNLDASITPRLSFAGVAQDRANGKIFSKQTARYSASHLAGNAHDCKHEDSMDQIELGFTHATTVPSMDFDVLKGTSASSFSFA